MQGPRADRRRQVPAEARERLRRAPVSRNAPPVVLAALSGRLSTQAQKPALIRSKASA